MITMYTMDNCKLCKKAKALLEYWKFQYVSVNIKPYMKRQYPYFLVDDDIVEYEELVDMIAKGKLRVRK